MSVSFIMGSSYSEDVCIPLARSKCHMGNLCCQFKTGSKEFGSLFVAFTVTDVLFQKKQLLDFLVQHSHECHNC